MVSVDSTVRRPEQQQKKLPGVIWGIFHFHTSAQGTVYWLQVPKPWETTGFLHGCFGCVPHFRPLFQTVSFVWALAGRKTENANECLCCEHTIWEASRFHFLSYKSWVLNSSYTIKMKFPVKLWTLSFVQVVERYRFATSQANPHSLKC